MGEREESFVDLWLFIIVATTIIAILINILALHYGTAAVAANLLYIPIVLAAYWYPRWGISYAIGVSALFIGTVACSHKSGVLPRQTSYLCLTDGVTSTK